MENVVKIIEEITGKNGINNISFVGCGGSLACFYPAYYYVTREAKTITANYISSNEFVHETPVNVGKNSIVVVATRRGTTAESVEAAKVAKKAGASVIGLSIVNESPLADTVDYLLKFNDVDPEPFETGKGAYALKVVVALLNAVEGSGKYEDMKSGFVKMNKIIPEARKKAVPDAIKFSINYKDDNIIYTMGSGTAWAAAHQESICIFMEMQWINSSVIHTGEFFHGPFEITNPDTAFLMLKSSGKTRALDDRAIEFLNNYNHHLTVIDAKEYGIDALGSVSEYFDALFYSELLGVYNHLLADMRNHPLSKRKYMWKYNY